MEPAGWIIMGLSVGSVMVLVTFCFYRVLTMPPALIDDMNTAPLQIDTRDTQDPI